MNTEAIDLPPSGRSDARPLPSTTSWRRPASSRPDRYRAGKPLPADVLLPIEVADTRYSSTCSTPPLPAFSTKRSNQSSPNLFRASSTTM